MTAPVIPSYDTPTGPPPTFPWAQRPPTGGPPPTALGGWGNSDGDIPDLPPVVALLYSYHIKQLQAQPGFREAGPLEAALLENLQNLHRLDHASLLELDLQLNAHVDALHRQLAWDRAMASVQPHDPEAKQQLATAEKLTERLTWLGRTLREYIGSKIVVQ